MDKEVEVRIFLSSSFHMPENATFKQIKKEVFDNIKLPEWVDVDEVRIWECVGDVGYLMDNPDKD